MTDLVKIGIDVGGTFTHLVIIKEATYEILAEEKVPTTHFAKEGVALGIIECLKNALNKTKIKPENIVRIAHSTTQATNALLEGDICPVGILAVGSGLAGLEIKRQLNFTNIELEKNIFIPVFFEYLEEKENLNQNIIASLKVLQKRGAEAIVAVNAFSVDNPQIELKILELATELGIPATATHEISQLYGLKLRTKTAVINASILPKMINTALQTETAIRSLNIKAPIVVMRSDGGAMLLSEMKKRPILTLLSGPAAGLSAAINYTKILDGIFLEVGGTSTDISVIINGKPEKKMAQIGEHRIYLNTLDIKTVGVAGGSLPKIQDQKIVDVGPRSAHITGLNYLSFAPKEDIKIENIALMNYKKDQTQYLQIEADNQFYTVTTTCTANFLNLIPENDYAYSKVAIIRQGFIKVSEFLGISVDVLANRIMELGGKKILAVISAFIYEKELKNEKIFLIGGGGGASTWLNYLQQKTGFEIKLAEHAPVISAIGAAISLIQETIEKTLIEPSEEDFINIRNEVEEKLIRAGADHEDMEIKVEVDRQKGILRAIAIGNQKINLQNDIFKTSTELEMYARNLFKYNNLVFNTKEENSKFIIFQFKKISKFFIFKSITYPLVVFTKDGIPKIKLKNAVLIKAFLNELDSKIINIIENYSSYTDAGQIIPKLFLFNSVKMVDFSGLINLKQLMALLNEEKKNFSNKDNFLLVVEKK